MKKKKNIYNMGGNVGSLVGSIFSPALGPLGPTLGNMIGNGVTNFIQSMEEPRPTVQPHGYNTNVYKHGGKLMNDYIFSDYLGIAKEAKTIAKKLNLPKDFIIEYKGNKHTNGGIDINRNLNPTNPSDNTNISGSQSSTPIANVEGGEVRINEKYKNGIGLNDISYRSARQAYSNLIAKNERMKQEYMYGGKVKQYQLGGGIDVPQYDNPYSDQLNELNFVPQFDSPVGTGQLGIPQYDNPYIKRLRNRINPIKPFQLNQPVTPPQAPTFPLTQTNEQTLQGSNQKLPILSNEQIAGIGGIGLDIASQLPTLLRGVEQEKIQLNPNRPRVESLYRNTRYNNQPIINRENNLLASLRRQIDNSTTSDAVRRSNLQSVYGNSSQRLSEIEMQGQVINNRLRQQEGNVLAQLGAQDATERIRQQTAQSQNQAAYDQGIRTLGKTLGNLGQSFLNADAQRKSINSTLDAMNQMFPNFNINSNYIEYQKRYQALKSRGYTDEQIRAIFENDSNLRGSTIRYKGE